MFFVRIHMTDLPGCYGSTVTGDKKISIILDFYCLREKGVDFVGT